MEIFLDCHDIFRATITYFSEVKPIKSETNVCMCVSIGIWKNEIQLQQTCSGFLAFCLGSRKNRDKLVLPHSEVFRGRKGGINCAEALWPSLCICFWMQM